MITKSWSRKQLFWVIIIAMGLVGFSSSSASCQSIDNKSSYRPYNFDRDPWLAGFKKNYPRDPIAIALKVAGYPNPDRQNPNEVHIYYRSSTKMTVVIRSFGLEDDSVAAADHRVDLTLRGRRWEIEWAGGKWQCRRELLPSIGWQNSLCS